VLKRFAEKVHAAIEVAETLLPTNVRIHVPKVLPQKMPFRLAATWSIGPDPASSLIAEAPGACRPAIPHCWRATGGQSSDGCARKTPVQ
jgi:hypothetical protein